MEKNLYLFQLSVLFEKMKDPDIADSTEASDVVGFYEWALGDNVGIHTTWNEIEKDISVDAKYVSSHDIDCKYFH